MVCEACFVAVMYCLCVEHGLRLPKWCAHTSHVGDGPHSRKHLTHHFRHSHFTEDWKV